MATKAGSRLLPTLAVLASMLLWGLSFVSSKAVLNTGFPPATMVTLRFLVATAILLPLRRRLEPAVRLANLGWRQRWLLAGSGFIGVTVYFFFESRGIKLTSASNAALIIAAIPIFTVLAEWLFFRGAVRWLQVAGIALSIVGVYFVVRRSPTHFPQALAGNLFMLGACLSWVAYVVLSRDLHEPLPGLSLTAYQEAVGAVTLLPFALSELPSWRLPTLGAWLNILYLGIFCSAGAYFFYMYALARLGPVRTASFTNLIPFIGALGGMVLLGEELSLVQLAGGLAVIAGVFLVNRRPASGSRVGWILFVLGGARSGKSRYAQSRAAAAAGPGRPVAFLATAEAGDEEMRRRIQRHRRDRPAGWITLEAPREAGRTLRGLGPEAGAVLVDCLTLLMSNLLLAAPDPAQGERAVLEEIGGLLAAARAAPVPVILVSNEVGQGVVPPTELGRAFRDIAGRAHQLVAAEADEVVFLTAGLPHKLK